MRIKIDRAMVRWSIGDEATESQRWHDRASRHRYRTIATVPSHHRTIASSCYRTIIIALSRHRIIVIELSQYRLKYRWCDDAVVNYRLYPDSIVKRWASLLEVFSLLITILLFFQPMWVFFSPVFRGAYRMKIIYWLWMGHQYIAD